MNENMTLIESIEALKRLLSGSSIDFESFRKNVPYRIMFSQNYYNSGSVYRAVVLNEENAKKPLYVSRFSYPDPDKGIPVSRGRANIEGFPVLYCSNSLAGAVDETLLTNSDSNREKKTRRLFVSEWYCEKTPSKVYDVERRIPIGQPKIDVDEVNNINIYLELIKKSYLSNNAYDFSSKWSHYHLYENNKPYLYDLISYSSAINKLTVNYAIHPEYFKKHYKLRRVFDIYLPVELNPEQEQMKIQFGSHIGIPDTNSDRLLIREMSDKDLPDMGQPSNKRWP